MRKQQRSRKPKQPRNKNNIPIEVPRPPRKVQAKKAAKEELE